MNPDVFKNPEFWLAIVFSFAVSFIMAEIVQYIYDELIRLLNDTDDDEELYTYSTADFEVGCLVKDIQRNYIGYYAGLSDNGLPIVVYTLDKTVIYYETNYNNLIVVEKDLA